ncbi:sorting nexin, putative [Ixodes scapularis]|uniref:Sorting nexin-16 n=1 Tax=Ixodes scapularis TaxID=6945 RepID=B7PEY2_IXOSC|nr:sorting nexin, putative [Ixodes scapularis]|eukprot:XP_002433754.1 sorting nexin, putative [Ixodes scapularis]
MASEAEVSHSPVLRTVEVERDGTSATDELTGQSLAQVGRYMYLKQDRRESLSSVSSDSGDVSNGREHLCDVEEENVVIVPEYNTPIIGYEVMEERARFTVFKIRVEHVESGRYWFVFRRYTDFGRLSKKLKPLFPGLQLSLPPKRWFGNNFDPMFLEDRLLGLQAFVKNIMGHRDISKSSPVREFFCLDDPPEPLDTIEESRALCENLEEKVYRLSQQLQERDTEIEVLRAELESLRLQQGVLVKALKWVAPISCFFGWLMTEEFLLRQTLAERQGKKD